MLVVSEGLQPIVATVVFSLSLSALLVAAAAGRRLTAGVAVVCVVMALLVTCGLALCPRG